MPRILTITLILHCFYFAAKAESVEPSAKDEETTISCLRAGIGVERSPYAELGYSHLMINSKGFGSSSNFYGAAQINLPYNSSAIYGGKIGFETSMLIGMWGVELKYLTDGHASQVYFTPKIGLSLCGTTSLLYGYNTPRRDALDRVGTHQISLTINISKKLLKYVQ